MQTIDQIEQAVNSGGQTWLSIDAQPQANGSVSLVVNVHGHFACEAADDSPAAIARALGELFDSMGRAVQRASYGVVGDSDGTARKVDSGALAGNEL